MADKTALVGVRLIDGSGAEPVDDATVVVSGASIASVTVGRTVERDITAIDGSGMTLIPGIVDAHCHLGGASAPDEDGWVLESDTYQAIASVHQARAMLAHGVTSVRDISVHGPHLKRAVRDGLMDGPRIVPCWRGLSRRGGHGDASAVSDEMVRRSHPWGIVADGPEEVRRVTREIIKRGSENIKVWASGGGLHENESEDAQHYSFEELRIMVEEARYVHLPVAAHCECAPAARDAVRAGVSSVEHGEELDAETIELMARNDVSLVPTLVLLRQWFAWSGDFGGYYGRPYVPGGGELPTDRDGLIRIHHERLSANLMAAKGAGIRIGVGSDSFSTELTPFGAQTLREVHELVTAGMSEMEALVAATRAGAEILRLAGITGTVEQGKRADLVLLGSDPLDDITRVNPENMLLIMADGRVVKDGLTGGSLQATPRESVLREVTWPSRPMS
jgi:imidazolonepropionase-like amidohydrolase